MRIHFDPNLDYQREAIDSIVGIFQGQEICRTNFTVAPLNKEHEQRGFLPGMEQTDLGVGNRLRLIKEEILENVQSIQLRNGLAFSKEIGSYDFTVEMETGTGKTYVYLRTIFELNLYYGFTKFIIVVPSVAIKEGVYKSLQMTEDHFRDLYDNAQFDYFVYDSQKLGQVRSFATNDSIQIMVINMVYKLDAVDAFARKLVKQIEVNGTEVEDGYNTPYIKLLSVDNRKNPIKAKLELDVRQKNGTVKRQAKNVPSGADLLDISGGRDMYEGYIIEEIYCKPGEEYISFTSKPEIIPLGQAGHRGRQ